MKNALIFWFTGLSGSGKTTIVDGTIQRLSNRDIKIKIFDGDVVRKEINSHLTFRPKDISENNRIIADLCLKESHLYDYIFVPVIAPFRESRDEARRLLGDHFYLVYCKISLEEVIRRDPKGLYRKALSGEIDNFIGIHKEVPFQPPKDADLVLDTEGAGIESCVGRLIEFIHRKEEERVGKHNER
ncbi:MAG: adenylyl-sulfate kinase [Deltaproteobacteria bacterium]|nr:adenylyl-sulfate kinase [Deltaproteobacteria bacterium]